MGPYIHLRLAQIIVGLGKIGFQGQRLFEAFDGVAGIAPVQQNVAQVAQRFGVIRLQCHRLSIAQGGVRRLVQSLQHQAQIEMDLR